MLYTVHMQYLQLLLYLLVDDIHVQSISSNSNMYLLNTLCFWLQKLRGEIDILSFSQQVSYRLHLIIQSLKIESITLMLRGRGDSTIEFISYCLEYSVRMYFIVSMILL